MAVARSALSCRKRKWRPDQQFLSPMNQRSHHRVPVPVKNRPASMGCRIRTIERGSDENSRA